MSTVGGGLFREASIAARRERYDEAGRLLVRAVKVGDCTEVQALDLQARMNARQGLKLKAEACWERARELDPSDPAYPRALAMLRGSPAKGGRLLPVLGGLILVIGLGAVVWQVGALRAEARHRSGAVGEGLKEVRAELTRMRGELKTADMGSDKDIDSLGRSIRALDVRLGTVIAELGGQLRGIKAELDQKQTSAAASRAMERVRTQLKQQADSVRSAIADLRRLAERDDGEREAKVLEHLTRLGSTVRETAIACVAAERRLEAKLQGLSRTLEVASASDRSPAEQEPAASASPEELEQLTASLHGVRFKLGQLELAVRHLTYWRCRKHRR